MARPKLFIGSSTEGRSIAEAIQTHLLEVCETHVWRDGVFPHTESTLEGLDRFLGQYDFAVLVLTPDDQILRKGKPVVVARDNVIFELGLFMGGLGRQRTFMVFDENRRPELPSDLAGITALTFEEHPGEKLLSDIAPVASRLKEEIKRLGVSSPEKLMREQTLRVFLGSNQLPRLASAGEISPMEPAKSCHLICYVTSLPNLGFDTGIVVINYPEGAGMAGRAQSAACRLAFRFYSQGGGSYIYVTDGASSGTGLVDGKLPTGGTYTVLVSQLLEAASIPPEFMGFVVLCADSLTIHVSAVVSNFTTFSQSADVLTSVSGGNLTAQT